MRFGLAARGGGHAGRGGLAVRRRVPADARRAAGDAGGQPGPGAPAGGRRATGDDRRRLAAGTGMGADAARFAGHVAAAGWLPGGDEAPHRARGLHEPAGREGAPGTGQHHRARGRAAAWPPDRGDRRRPGGGDRHRVQREPRDQGDAGLGAGGERPGGLARRAADPHGGTAAEHQPLHQWHPHPRGGGLERPGDCPAARGPAESDLARRRHGDGARTTRRSVPMSAGRSCAMAARCCPGCPRAR